MRVLFSWLGLDETNESAEDKRRPLTQALPSLVTSFDRIVILNNLPEPDARRWYRTHAPSTRVQLVSAPLSRPVDYGEIHRQALRCVEEFLEEHGRDCELSFFLNSGTPPMGSVWLILGKSRYDAKLVGWSTFGKRIENIDVPFQISAEVMPRLLRDDDAALVAASGERAPRDAAFESMIGACPLMKAVVARAATVAPHSVPVLLEGETGTGKEVLASAIHNASGRKGPLVAVNCGAIPENLIESELFGHVKGAFSGADRDRPGHFREAHGGTLFLDEIGELPLSAQVRLLRPLDKGVVTPVGSSRAHPVDVRIIAATHRSLVDDVAQGAFREDLFYRLAVAVIRLPRLRDREGDVHLLADRFVEEHNVDLAKRGFPGRSLGPDTREVLMRHGWPGNVRELRATLRRAMVWSSRLKLDAAAISDALLPGSRRADDAISATIGPGFRLDEVLARVEAQYIEQAMSQSGGSIVKAARMLGLNSHQALYRRIPGARARREKV